ncbi:MAG: hypothetical protein BLM47_01320 [Candidatus Reconcilbacillus cellulovorans]|uniref:Uncharacterized protein n=1 Tax=Candidatus Reconcilbacillus cellulovorans TaxID=1906605 RepID=A0A2A6E411_9BACL|nr:MAG: hypothetical protein BLM47_01320 [Candidatus Reconcilbacillus cellulovorans]
MTPERKLAELLNPGRRLAREDVVWMLEYVKQKSAEKDSAFARLPQPTLLEFFHRFADAAMALIRLHPATAESCAEQFREALRNIALRDGR